MVVGRWSNGTMPIAGVHVRQNQGRLRRVGQPSQGGNEIRGLQGQHWHRTVHLLEYKVVI